MLCSPLPDSHTLAVAIPGNYRNTLLVFSSLNNKSSSTNFRDVHIQKELFKNPVMVQQVKPRSKNNLLGWHFFKKITSEKWLMGYNSDALPLESLA